MGFKEMDTDVVLQLVEGHKDILTSLAEEDDRFLSRLICPQCGAGEMGKKLKVRSPFIASNPLPQWDAECPHCGCEFDPHSRLILKAGTLVSSV